MPTLQCSCQPAEILKLQRGKHFLFQIKVNTSRVPRPLLGIMDWWFLAFVGILQWKFIGEMQNMRADDLPGTLLDELHWWIDMLFSSFFEHNKRVIKFWTSKISNSFRDDQKSPNSFPILTIFQAQDVIEIDNKYDHGKIANLITRQHFQTIRGWLLPCQEIDAKRFYWTPLHLAQSTNCMPP